MPELPVATGATVLAAGAFLKNRCALLEGNRLQWSALHGDLGQAAACAAMDVSLQALREAAETPVQAVAHDLHPDFASTGAALALAARLGVPAVAVQHHHAHVAVVMAERGWLDEATWGWSLDGVGLGSDGTAWGGELLRARPDGHFERHAHLAPLALPGGDAAAREPWRVAAAVLHGLGRDAEIEDRFAPLVGRAMAQGVATLLARDLRCPRSSAAGRWFDAAAAALGLAPHRQQEAEAAIALERAATLWLEGRSMPALPAPTLDLHTLIGGLFDDTDAGRGAALFHGALAAGLVQAAAQAGVTRLALTGGCFHNRLLSRLVSEGCARHGIEVHRPLIDCGDAGLALGQAWVAAQRLRSGTATFHPENP